MNRIFFNGRIGKDVKTKKFNEGKENESIVTNFSVAENTVEKNKEGQKVEAVNWHSCTMWGHEKLIPYLKQGTRVSVVAILKYGSYPKQVGSETVTMPTTEFMVDELELMDSKKD